MTTRTELETLLSTDPEEVRDRERHGFDRVAGPGVDGVVLYGAGGLGRRTLAGLRRLGVEPLAFADNSPTLQGSAIEGCPVLSPRDAVDRFNDRATFVTTVWGAFPRQKMAGRRQKEIRDLLQGLGCRRVVNFTSLYFKHPETFLPFYAVDLPHRVLEQADEVRRGFDLMADESSRREYVAQVRWRLLQDFDALPTPVEDEQYFCDDLYRARPDEWYVDCGAYDGDTLLEFVARRGDRFEHFLAIEPDPLNFEKLKACAASLPPSQARRVEARQLATGSTRSTLSLDPTGLPSSTVGGAGTVEVECFPLDELLDGRAPTVIKMDIEGAEGDTIRGAERSIREHQPLLEVCVYHLQDHLWTLPLLIDSIKPGYRYYLRPHKYEVWDLVCYAVPPDRMPA